MSNQYDDFDDFDDEEVEESGGIKDLRKQLNKLKRENKALLEENGTLKKSERTRSVKDVLSTKKLDPRIAAFIPADVEDIDKWVGEYGDLFAAPASAGDTESAPPASGELNPGGTGFFTEEELAATGVIQTVNGESKGQVSANDLLAKIQQTTSQAELLKLIAHSG